MRARTGSGSSTRQGTKVAVAEALAAAQEGLAGAHANFGLVFASPQHDLSAALSEASEAVSGAEFHGCTTAGEITERGLTRGGLTAFLVASDDLLLSGGMSEGVQADPAAAARTLCADFASSSKRGVERGLHSSTTVLLVDGLNGAGESLVEEIRSATGPRQQVVGGAAGDDAAFDETFVGRGSKTAKNAATALHVFPDTPIAGLLTYGEIARFTGRLDGWHNATAVVVAIPA